MILINFKNYIFGEKALRLAKKIEKYLPNAIVAVANADIELIKNKTDLKVYSEYIEHKKIDKNAKGSLLNHSEHRISFNNIKKDVAAIKDQIIKLENADLDTSRKLTQLDSVILGLEPKFEKFEISQKNKKEKIEEQIIQENQDHHDNIIKSLTVTQQEIFKTIYAIQQQLETDNISIKSLAKVYYPTKKYEDVRSTLSEYLTILSTMGLVAKNRKGKESYVNITKTGSKIINKLNIKFDE